MILALKVAWVKDCNWYNPLHEDYTTIVRNTFEARSLQWDAFWNGNSHLRLGNIQFKIAYLIQCFHVIKHYIWTIKRLGSLCVKKRVHLEYNKSKDYYCLQNSYRKIEYFSILPYQKQWQTETWESRCTVRKLTDVDRDLIPFLKENSTSKDLNWVKCVWEKVNANTPN